MSSIEINIEPTPTKWTKSTEIHQHHTMTDGLRDGYIETY